LLREWWRAEEPGSSFPDKESVIARQKECPLEARHFGGFFCDRSGAGDEAKLWYDSGVKRLGTRPNRRRGATNVTIGRERFAKISAIEGIQLSPAAKKRAAEFDRLGLSAEERIRRIVAVHRKG
jgi:hypothetical protein